MKKLKGKILFTIFTLLSFCLLLTSDSKAENSLKQISISPTYWEIRALKGEEISNQFLLEYSNFTLEEIKFEFYESNAELSQRNLSEVLKSNTTVQINPENKVINLSVNTKNFELGKKYFLIEILLKENNTGTIGNQISVTLPILLDILDGNDLKVVPNIRLSSDKQMYFDTKDINIEIDYQNQTPSNTNFNAELVAFNSKNEIVYTALITQSGIQTEPGKIYKKMIRIENLPGNNNLPYFGKLNFLIRGNVNNIKSFETSTYSIYIIPLKFILLIFLTLVTVALSGYFISKFRKTKRNKWKIQLDKRK